MDLIRIALVELNRNAPIDLIWTALLDDKAALEGLIRNELVDLTRQHV
jgi:hypothetical protein